MKKLTYLLAALAIAVGFTSCDKDDDNTDLNRVVEDGFYVAGEATGSTDLVSDCRMAVGVNEVDGKTRDGMYEKYVALEGGKDFYLTLKDGVNETRYSANLEVKGLTGTDDQPGSADAPFNILKGSLVTGADAPAMRVAEDGLYHIILDLNKAGDLDLTGGAQIVIAPVEWGVRGINDDWSWKPMTRGDFNMKKMTWTIHFDEVSTGSFKFAYGGGWKIQLDDAGNVKANTNLGADAVNGGENIKISKSSNVTITLTWNLKSGEISKSYAYNVEGTKIIEDPSTYSWGLIGNAFMVADTVSAWDYDLPLTYQPDLSTITDNTEKEGTYVYTRDNVELISGSFKIRKDAAWGVSYGYSADNIIGNDVANFTEDGGNIHVNNPGTYNLKFTYKKPELTWTLELNKVTNE